MTMICKHGIVFLRRSLWVLAFLLIGFPATMAEATGNIAISTTITPPGTTVLLPVILSSATDIAGVNIRIEYDPSVFSSPGVVRGSLLEDSHLIFSNASGIVPPLPQKSFEGNHLIFSNSPGTARLCALAYSYDASPFTSQTGTVFSLSFMVSASAPDGVYAISFSTDSSGYFPSSGLSDLAGNRLEHTQTAGSITVDSSAPPQMPYDINRDGMVDAADLLLFYSDWLTAPNAERSNFDQSGMINHQDLFLFSRWWMYDYR